MRINSKQKNKGYRFTKSYSTCLKRSPEYSKGFTLIELMVATSLFVVIMLSALSALFMLLDESKNSRALRFAMDNVNFAMESMTRSIRMGTNYYCASSGYIPLDNNNTLDCPAKTTGGGNLLVFSPQKEEGSSVTRVGYQLNKDGSILRYDNLHTSDPVSITSPDVKIESLRFFVNGADGIMSPNTQPSVYIIMKGTVMVKNVPTSFSIQTLASQRNF